MFNSRSTVSELLKHVLHLEKEEVERTVGLRKVVHRNSAIVENCFETCSAGSSTLNIFQFSHSL